MPHGQAPGRWQRSASTLESGGDAVGDLVVRQTRPTSRRTYGLALAALFAGVALLIVAISVLGHKSKSSPSQAAEAPTTSTTLTAPIEIWYDQVGGELQAFDTARLAIPADVSEV